MLKDHLLKRKAAESYHGSRRIGQEQADPTYFQSLDSEELLDPYPVPVSQDPNLLQSHRSFVSQVQRMSGQHHQL